eukprot:scaffold256305_cov28-Prasinocladus_malaysianus.AAC.1
MQKQEFRMPRVPCESRYTVCAPGSGRWLLQAADGWPAVFCSRCSITSLGLLLNAAFGVAMRATPEKRLWTPYDQCVSPSRSGDGRQQPADQANAMATRKPACDR